MSAYPTGFVSAVFGRGGFASERAFRLELADGTKLCGSVPWKYCFIGDGSKQLDYEPAADTELDGFLECQIINNILNSFHNQKIYLPNGDVCFVRKEILRLSLCRNYGGGRSHASSIDHRANME